MRHLQKFILVIPLIVGMLFMGCGGDDDSDPPENNNGILKATVAEASDTSFESSIATGQITKINTGSFIQYTFLIEGEENGSKRKIGFSIISATEPVIGTSTFTVINGNLGVYIENFGTPTEMVWLAPDASDPDPNAIYGNVNFTELTTARAKGTFTFNAVENPSGATLRTVTSGTFDVPLTRLGF